jgi:hypothetical protein
MFAFSRDQPNLLARTRLNTQTPIVIQTKKKVEDKRGLLLHFIP